MVVIDGTTERITPEIAFHVGSRTVVKSSRSCAMQEPQKWQWGLEEWGESPCYSEDTHAFDLVSAAAKRNCPASVFLKRWIVSASSSKSVV